MPLRTLVDFTRFSLEAGERTKACFAIPRKRFALTNASGQPTVYRGEHLLIFSRGNGHETSANFTL